MLAVAAAVCVAPIDDADRMDSKISAYARRSVQIVALGQKGKAEELSKIVSPDAEFDIGSGDVGRPLGKGVDGALATAKEILGADRYRFRTFSGPPPGTDEPCSPIDVEVDFYSRDGSSVIPMTFTYDRGMLQSAKGWHVGETVGDVDAVIK